MLARGMSLKSVSNKHVTIYQIIRATISNRGSIILIWIWFVRVTPANFKYVWLVNCKTTRASRDFKGISILVKTILHRFYKIIWARLCTLVVVFSFYLRFTAFAEYWFNLISKKGICEKSFSNPSSNSKTKPIDSFKIGQRLFSEQNSNNGCFSTLYFECKHITHCPHFTGNSLLKTQSKAALKRTITFT